MGDSKQAFDFLKKKLSGEADKQPEPGFQAVQVEADTKPARNVSSHSNTDDEPNGDLKNSGTIIDTPYSVIRAEYAVMERAYDELLRTPEAKKKFQEWLAGSKQLEQLNTLITKRLKEMNSPKGDKAKAMLQLRAIMTMWRQAVQQTVTSLVAEDQPQDQKESEAA